MTSALSLLRSTLLAALVWLCLAPAWAGVEVNKAKEAELDGVRGLGPTLTARILKAREKGPFRSWEEFITRVPGIGPTRAAQLSGQGLTVDGQSYSLHIPAAPQAGNIPQAPKAPPAPDMPAMPAKPKL